jgi:hypothetical protein
MNGKKAQKSLKKFFNNNSLTLVLFGIFFISFIGLSFSGLKEYNSEQKAHHEQSIRYPQYLLSSHFQEAIFENWESEFLQMWALVVLTIFLRQKGSPESKKMKGKEEVDTSSKHTILGHIYSNSLGLALLSLFVLSFLLHGFFGHLNNNQELSSHGEAPVSLAQYFMSSAFWFESFQNWQSEFLSVGILIVFTIYLRQKGSPESKPDSEENSKTGK